MEPFTVLFPTDTKLGGTANNFTFYCFFVKPLICLLMLLKLFIHVHVQILHCIDVQHVLDKVIKENSYLINQCKMFYIKSIRKIVVNSFLLQILVNATDHENKSQCSGRKKH